jgi:group I intron endonuclease
MKNKISGIYCIENTINNKKYIGFSIDIYDRWKHHKKNLRHNKHQNKYLLNAWNKYGERNFRFYIIKELPSDEEILKKEEIYFIQYYNSFIYNKKGYNLTEGGDGCLGHIITEKERERRKKSISGKNNPMYGKTHTEENKKIMSCAAKIANEKTKKWKGESNPRSTLKENDVFEILYMIYNKNLSNTEIASLYNISYGNVWKIKNGKRWKEIYKKFMEES